MVKAMCEKTHTHEKVMELMQMLYLNEASDRLAKASNVCWYGHVIRVDSSYVLRRALKIEGPKRKNRSLKTCKKQDKKS